MKNRLWTIIFVLVIPYTAIVAAFPFYNRAEPFVLGFPFIYFWIFLWFFLSSACMYIGWRLDPEAGPNLAKKRALEGGQDK